MLIVCTVTKMLYRKSIHLASVIWAQSILYFQKVNLFDIYKRSYPFCYMGNTTNIMTNVNSFIAVFILRLSEIRGLLRMKIFTDSSADLPKAFYEKEDVHLFPIRVLIKGVEYEDVIGISTDQVYAAIEEGEILKTSQVSLEAFLDIIKL